ncbi:Ion channel, partial [Teladorsagia circumcincta]
DRDNCIVLKIDTQMTSVQDCSPFGFHFELDKKRYTERKKQIRRQKFPKPLSRAFKRPIPRNYYKTMLMAEDRFRGSVWHKAENLDLHLMWYYSSATFYAMTLFTTIGYGTIVCQTVWGRILSVVYACIGIPLMLVVLGDIGEWFQKILTKTYIFFLIKWSNETPVRSIVPAVGRMWSIRVRELG